MIYRMNLDDAFLNGLNASLIESLTLNASLIGEGGAWQLLLNDNTLISGSDIGNAVESYNDGTELKDLLRKDSTNYISPDGERCPRDGTGGVQCGLFLSQG